MSGQGITCTRAILPRVHVVHEKFSDFIHNVSVGAP